MSAGDGVFNSSPYSPEAMLVTLKQTSDLSGIIIPSEKCFGLGDTSGAPGFDHDEALDQRRK
jgi:hypothetical protein